jgi:muramoyltetrapeptide carboxypeptidase
MCAEMKQKYFRQVSVIKPLMLMPGDHIGILSPAGPVNASDLQNGLEVLESSGYRIHLAPHIYDAQGYLAGDDKDRLEDLHAMFNHRDIKAIMCARGGYGSMRLLDRIDYHLIKRNPKIIIGYSDITALLLAIYTKTGLITFHGPTVKELSSKNQTVLDHLLQIISTQRPVELKLPLSSVLIAGRASGTFLGGNLSLISHLLGTPYLTTFDHCILFLEEKGELPYRVDRMLIHLRLSGQLEKIAGIVAGEFKDCGEMEHIHHLLINAVEGLGIPVIAGLPAGHGLKNLALPIGITANLNTDQMILSFDEACVDG